MLTSADLNKVLPVIEQDHMSYVGIDCRVDGKCVVVSIVLCHPHCYCLIMSSLLLVM